MNFKSPSFLLPAALILTFLAACYPVDDDAIEDYDLAVTIYDKEYYSAPDGINKFQNFQSFCMTTSINHVIEDGEIDDISRKFDAAIIETVASNMISLGYTQLDSVDSPDLYMSLAITKTTFENYNFYFSGGGWYYPWASYGMYTTTYETGSLLMEMIETSRIDTTNPEIPAVWAGMVQGIIEESKNNNIERLTKNIDQCFIQSPYLTKDNQ